MNKRIKLFMLVGILPIIASLITVARIYHDMTYYGYIDMASYSPFLIFTYGLAGVAAMGILLYIKVKKL